MKLKDTIQNIAEQYKKISLSAKIGIATGIIASMIGCAKFNPLESYKAPDGKVQASQVSQTAFDNDGERNIDLQFSYNNENEKINAYSANAIIKTNNVDAGTISASVNNNVINTSYTGDNKGLVETILAIHPNYGEAQAITNTNRIYAGETESDQNLEAYLASVVDVSTTNYNEIQSYVTNVNVAGTDFDGRVSKGDGDFFFVHFVGQRNEIDYTEQQNTANMFNKDLVVIKEGENPGQVIEQYLNNL